jgi:hypothetical protein
LTTLDRYKDQSPSVLVGDAVYTYDAAGRLTNLQQRYRPEKARELG